MWFVDINSHVATKQCNLDIKCLGNSETYERHGFLRTILGVINFFMLGSFFNKTGSSITDWLASLKCNDSNAIQSRTTCQFNCYVNLYKVCKKYKRFPPRF